MPVHSPSLSAITLPLHFPATHSLALCDHASSLSHTLHQSPSPFSISCRCRYHGLCCTLFKPSPYLPSLITGMLLCRFTILRCIYFVGNGWLSEGFLALPKSSIFSICFMGMTQVQILCREEEMIISASYFFYYLKMGCWKSSIWYCQNKWLLWKEQNSCIFEDTNWLKTRLESLLIRTLVDWSRAWGAYK